MPGFVQYGHIMFLPIGWLPLAWVAARRGWWQWAAACLALSFFAGGHYLLLYGALWLALDAVFRGFARDGVRWLALPLGVNAVFLGTMWLKWLVVLGVVVVLARWRPRRLKERTVELTAVAVLAALLVGVKLTTAPVLFERAERLEAQNQTVIADVCPSDSACYGSIGETLSVMSGATERLSGHEGQNVFWSPWPVIIGLVGLVLAAFMKPAWGLIGLVFWCVGWGGVTPFNCLEWLHRLPGFDHIRVVERYSLVWTMFLGWGAGFLLDLAFHKGRRWAALPIAILLLSWVHKAAPEARELMSFVGPHRHTPTPLVEDRFEQVISASSEQCRRGEGSPSDWYCSIAFQDQDTSAASRHTNYESIRSGKGRLDSWTTAWLADPSPALRAKGQVGYQGEAWISAGGEKHQAAAHFTTRSIRIDAPLEGELTVNQNAVRGWRLESAGVKGKDGLLSTHVSGGSHRLVYEPPGLLLGFVLSGAGLLLLCVFGRRKGFVFRSSGNGPPR